MSWFVINCDPDGDTSIQRYDDFEKLLADLADRMDNTEFITQLDLESKDLQYLSTGDKYGTIVIKGIIEMAILGRQDDDQTQ